MIFPVGSTQASFEIVINFNDNILENDEKFNISVTSITNDHIKSIPGVATVTIIDTTSKCLRLKCRRIHNITLMQMGHVRTYVRIVYSS